MRAREYPSGLIRAASKAPDVKVARSLPGGSVFGKMTTVHVLILPMPQESLERSHRSLRRVLRVNGIGGYDLADPADRVFAFDYNA